jgi:hypothetical protein
MLPWGKASSGAALRWLRAINRSFVRSLNFRFAA